MAILTGTVGKVKVDANDLGESSTGTISIVIDTAESTELGDDWKTYIPLAKSWTLNASVLYDPANAAQLALRTEFISGDGNIAILRMYEDDTKYFTGAAIVTGFSVVKGINAADTVALTFIGNGALAVG